jgi:hypothetical protein
VLWTFILEFSHSIDVYRAWSGPHTHCCFYLVSATVILSIVHPLLGFCIIWRTQTTNAYQVVYSIHFEGVLVSSMSLLVRVLQCTYHPNAHIHLSRWNMKFVYMFWRMSFVVTSGFPCCNVSWYCRFKGSHSLCQRLSSVC